MSGPRVVVLGGGVNGLVAAATLARAGLAPVVIERREVLGGAAATEEFAPGFRASASPLGSPLRAGVVQSLGLGSLPAIAAEPRVYGALPDARGLAAWKDAARTAAEAKRFSARDGEAFPAYHRAVTRIAAWAAPYLDVTPPDLDSPSLGDAWQGLRTAVSFRALGREDGQRLLRWGPMAVADLGAEWFEGLLLRSLVSARGVYGLSAGPWSAGTAAHFLLQAAASLDDGLGTSLTYRGGLGTLVKALAEVVAGSGGTIRTSTAVQQLVVKDDRVTAVILAGGEEVPARAVLSSLHPQTTFLRLIDPPLLDPDDRQAIVHYRTAGMCARVDFALSGLPAFRGVDDPALLRARIVMAGEVDFIERAFDEAKYGRLPARPWLEATIPTLADSTLAPEGGHVLSVHLQYTARQLRGTSWADQREPLGDLVLQRLEEYAPGLSGLVRHRRVLTPEDLETTYGLSGGHPFHGELSLDQLFLARPLLGWGRYRGPFAGLYLCGAGTHPGGLLTGASGANAAREALRDLR